METSSVADAVAAAREAVGSRDHVPPLARKIVCDACHYALVGVLPNPGMAIDDPAAEHTLAVCTQRQIVTQLKFLNTELAGTLRPLKALVFKIAVEFEKLDTWREAKKKAEDAAKARRRAPKKKTTSARRRAAH